jgi:tRNA pseudouridine32 synthase/23S rRNA pseudouridine746 synthase
MTSDNDLYRHPFKDPFFKALDLPATLKLPETFSLMLNAPHPLCLPAAADLQRHLATQNNWQHNFGLSEHATDPVIGKMFGVLVVRTTDNRIGYLAAFSGKLANSNHLPGFIPPVFDSLDENSFLNSGMREITRITQKIARINMQEAQKGEVLRLKQIRRELSVSLQEQLYDHYHFLNRAGEEKNLRDLFSAAAYKNPPAGAGECAGPKLLQYAFIHHMKPLALAEFWWGQSPKSHTWKHGHFYACCKEKCEPILAHMLKGIDD